MPQLYNWKETHHNEAFNFFSKSHICHFKYLKLLKQKQIVTCHGQESMKQASTVTPAVPYEHMNITEVTGFLHTTYLL